MENIIKFVVAGIGSGVAYLFGGWSVLLQVLILFVAIDYLTGLIAGAYSGTLSSKIGFKGIAKKVMIFALVAVAYAVDTILGDNHFFRDAVIFFFLANELISILENAGRTGLPIPSALTRAVDILHNKSDGKGEGK